MLPRATTAEGPSPLEAAGTTPMRGCLVQNPNPVPNPMHQAHPHTHRRPTKQGRPQQGRPSLQTEAGVSSGRMSGASDPSDHYGSCPGPPATPREAPNACAVQVAVPKFVVKSATPAECGAAPAACLSLHAQVRRHPVAPVSGCRYIQIHTDTVSGCRYMRSDAQHTQKNAPVLWEERHGSSRAGVAHDCVGCSACGHLKPCKAVLAALVTAAGLWYASIERVKCVRRNCSTEFAQASSARWSWCGA